MTQQSSPNLATVKSDHITVGWNALRVVALAMVTAHHFRSLLELENWTSWGGVSASHLRVILFLALSGRLCSYSKSPPFPWMWRRIKRIYPGYLVTLTLCFLLEHFCLGRQVSLSQIAGQYVGFGYFLPDQPITHDTAWFVPFLVACYALVFLDRLTSNSKLLAWGACILVLSAHLLPETASLVPHVLSFLLAYVFPYRLFERPLLLAGLLYALFLLGLFADPAIAYVFLALAIVEVFSWITISVPIINWLAKYSYEYYLLHGIALYGAVKVLSLPPILALVFGVSLALIASVAMHKFLEPWTNTSRA